MQHGEEVQKNMQKNMPLIGELHNMQTQCDIAPQDNSSQDSHYFMIGHQTLPHNSSTFSMHGSDTPLMTEHSLHTTYDYGPDIVAQPSTAQHSEAVLTETAQPA